MEVVVVEREGIHVSEESLPPEPVEALLETVVMSLLRAELLPACLNVLMISGTWKDNENIIRMTVRTHYVIVRHLARKPIFRLIA